MNTIYLRSITDNPIRYFSDDTLYAFNETWKVIVLSTGSPPNERTETQERILAEIEQKIAEVRAPQSETHGIPRKLWTPGAVIAGVGVLAEEEVP